MAKKIAEKLWKMYLFREEMAKGNNELYVIRDARLNGAISLAKAMGFNVKFNPIADNNQNPFIVEEKEN